MAEHTTGRSSWDTELSPEDERLFLDQHSAQLQAELAVLQEMAEREGWDQQ